MKTVFKVIRNIIIIVFLIGIVTALIDYARMYGGDMPIFCTKSYNQKTKIQKFRGLFYESQRKIRANINESLVDSTKIKYKIFMFKLDIPRQFREETFEFNLDVSPSEECSESSKLYYADLDVKVYTYCLDDIGVKEATESKSKSLDVYLKKDTSILEEIASKIAFTGKYIDNSSLMFTSVDHQFANNGIQMVMCNNTNVNDVYLFKEGVDIQKDFCTYKDDDFKFIFKIFEEEKEETSEEIDEDKKAEPETFYEDEEYLYQFDEPKLDRIYITTPNVRGKDETKTPLREILNTNKLTIEELSEKGLKFNKVKKEVPKEE